MTKAGMSPCDWQGRLKAIVESNGEFPWVDWDGPTMVMLDGMFTADELRSIANLLDEAKRGTER